MRHSLNTVITVFLFLSFASSASEQTRVEELHNEVYRLLDTDLDAAMILADSSLLLAQEAGLEWEEANSYYIKGYIYDERSELSNAVVMYLQSAKILDLLYQESEKAAKTYTSILLNTGSILRKYCKYDESIELLDMGLDIARYWKLENQQLKLLYNKASAFYFQGSQSSSLEILKEVTSLANQLDNTTFLLKSFNLLGLAHKDGGYHVEARKYYQYILDHPDVREKQKAGAYHNIAVSYYSEEVFDSAKYYYDQALEIKRALDNPSLLFSTLQSLSEWHLVRGDFQKAENYAVEAMYLYDSIDQTPETFKIFHLLGDILEAQLNLSKAKLYSDKAFEESLLFHEKQKAIMREKDKFQMDLVLAGFEAEQMAHEEQKKAARYRWLAVIGGLLVVIVLITWKLWFVWWRRSLWQSIEDVM